MPTADHRARREKNEISTGSVIKMTNGASIMPVTTTTASGFCTCDPIPARQRRRQQADASDHAGHQHRPELQFAGSDHRLDAIETLIDQLIVLRQDDDAVLTAIPNSAMKPIAAETLKGIPLTKRPSTPPKIAIGITLIASSVSTIEPKLNHNNTAISVRLIGTTIDSRRMASCSCRIRRPIRAAIPAQLDLRLDLLLRLADRAAEVALAHRELDRQIAFLLLAIDIGRAGHQLDRGDFA